MADYGRVEWQRPEDAETTHYYSVAVISKESAEAIKKEMISKDCLNVRILPGQ